MNISILQHFSNESYIDPKFSHTKRLMICTLRRNESDEWRSNIFIYLYKIVYAMNYHYF